jgi:hypothetical protein
MVTILDRYIQTAAYYRPMYVLALLLNCSSSLLFFYFLLYSSFSFLSRKTGGCTQNPVQHIDSNTRFRLYFPSCMKHQLLLANVLFSSTKLFFRDSLIRKETFNLTVRGFNTAKYTHTHDIYYNSVWNI